MKQKRFESIILNGKSFELDHKIAGAIFVTMTIRGVDDCYGRPSDTKRRIWSDWADWFMSHDGICTVHSYNSNFFTISGIVTDIETSKRYECYITPAHNYCYEVQG